ncbi:ABC transporter substrate-binding protein [Vibrio sp. PP-XX7]
MQLLVAGRTDLLMGYQLSSVKAVSEGLPVVTVAAVFQKDPQAIIAHPNIKSLQELADKKIPVYLSASAYSKVFLSWLKAKYGFSHDQGRPYTFSVAPFLANPNVAQQGYITSEPYAIEKGGIKPSIFLMADDGYIPYAETIETTRQMLKDRPDVVNALYSHHGRLGKLYEKSGTG